MDYARVLQFAPLAKATYGANNGAGSLPVGNWQPVLVKSFDASSPDFHATLYQDATTGKYRVAIAGSDNSGDWTGPNAVLSAQVATSTIGVNAWNSQMTDAIRFTAEAIKQIRDDYAAANNNAIPSFDYVRSKLDVTGHSLGGALAELVGKFYGIGGANIDGPGVSALVNSPTFASLKNQVQKELSELESNYTLAPGQFSAHAFTTVGTTGRHLSDVVSEVAPEAYIGDAVIGVGAGIAPVVPLVGVGAAGAESLLLLGHKMDQIINRSRAALGLPVDGSDDNGALMGHVDALGNYQPGTSNQILDSSAQQGAAVTKTGNTSSTELPPISPAAATADMGALNAHGGENVAGASDVDLNRSPPTVFNAATALPGYSGQQGVTVQSGDTITAIAQRYGMDAGEYTAFLQQHYGPGADLDSIVAGRRLPLPAEVYERTQGGINGLDSTEPANASAPGSSSAPTASTPPAEPPVDNSKPSIQNPSSSQQVEFESSPPTNPANEPAQQTQDQATEQTSISLVQLTQSAALLSSVLGLQHWTGLSEVQRLASLSGLYNQLDHIGSLGSHDNLPGDLGSAAAAFNLLASLEQGHLGGSVLSGLNLANALADNMASEANQRTCQRLVKRRCVSIKHHARNAL